MKKILLIDTNTTPFNEAFPVYPIGLDYIEGAIKKEGPYKTHILDLTRAGGPLSSPDFTQRKKKSLEIIKKILSGEHWDIIGLSLRNIDSTYPVGHGDPRLHYYLPDLLEYVDCVRACADKNAVIVLGGTAFSMMPEVFMERRRENGYGILGAAESSFPSVIGAVLAGEPVPRITRTATPGIGMLQNRSLIKKYMDMPVGESTFGIRTRLGCGQFCGYCPYPLISGPGQYLKGIDQVLEEIRLLRSVRREAGSGQPVRVMFADDIFNRPLAHAKEILRAMIEENEIPGSWHAYLDPKNIDEEFVELILRTNGWSRLVSAPASGGRSLRGYHFLFDIESGSSRMLKMIGKSFNMEDIMVSVNTFKKVARRFEEDPAVASVQFGFHVLLGYPGEDRESVKETCCLINELDPAHVQVQVGVRVYPKTRLAGETKGILWKTEEDLIKPLFADMNIHETLDWLKMYLHKRYTRIEQKGNMILINKA